MTATEIAKRRSMKQAFAALSVQSPDYRFAPPMAAGCSRRSKQARYHRRHLRAIAGILGAEGFGQDALLERQLDEERTDDECRADKPAPFAECDRAAEDGKEDT